MQILNNGDHIYIYSAPEFTSVTKDWFTSSYWQEQDAILGKAQGRGTTWFIKSVFDAIPDFVLRHYYRGGLIAKINIDNYFYCGISKTRAYLEYELLDILFNEGFAVAKPIAAHIKVTGCLYRADIITEFLRETSDLVVLLQQRALLDDELYFLGKTIAQFHKRGLDHADLNIKNILYDGKTFYLIDLDKGKLRTPEKSWQQQNLSRLHRSFFKEKNKYNEFYFNFNTWRWILKGYKATICDGAE